MAVDSIARNTLGNRQALLGSASAPEFVEGGSGQMREERSNDDFTEDATVGLVSWVTVNADTVV